MYSSCVPSPLNIMYSFYPIVDCWFFGFWFRLMVIFDCGDGGWWLWNTEQNAGKGGEVLLMVGSYDFKHIF